MNKKISKAMKKMWKNNREEIMEKRSLPEFKLKQSKSIKKHFRTHPSHKKAISEAQKSKWAMYKKAVKYCKDNGIDLGGFE